MTRDPFDELRRLANRFPVSAVVETFDANFDLTMRHAEATWLLTIHDAFRSADVSDIARLTERVGAFWCRIVSADVRFQLLDGLTAVAESADDARRLRAVAGRASAYAAARWADGAGKLLYRTSSHARGRMLFEDACRLADGHDLWWCKPDMLSNWLRSELQEAEQAGDARLAQLDDLARRMRAARMAQAAVGDREGVRPDVAPDATAPVKHREFVRGNLSLAHNLSIVLERLGRATDDAALFTESGELIESVVELSRATHDGYREAQAILQQAQLVRHERGPDAPLVRELLGRLCELKWERGKFIAVQQIAELDGGVTGVSALVRQVEGAAGNAAGVDLEITTGAIRRARNLLEGVPEAERPAWVDRLSELELQVARSVRQVIALPAYKRAYSGTVRPVYLEAVRRSVAAALEDADAGVEVWEDVLGLVEESTGRELLDLMSSSALPPVASRPDMSAVVPSVDDASGPAADGGAPAAGASTTGPAALVRGDETRQATRSARRGTPRRETDPIAIEADRKALLEREREFERQFLRNPLRAAPHDPEIADKADRYVVNTPGSCIVRYFAYGVGPGGAPERLGAFVIRDGMRRPVECGRLDRIRDLVDRMLTPRRPGRDDGPHPDLDTAEGIWELLLAPLWPHMAPEGDEPRHLLIVPTDDLFAVPFSIALPAGGVPLAARVPLSLSVSLSAFLLRGRSALLRQRVADTDDLAAMVLQDYDKRDLVWAVSGNEVARAGWPAGRLHLAGDWPWELGEQPSEVPEADWAGLATLTESRPEFFVYAGHGRYVPEFGELGPCLQIRVGDQLSPLTSYDVALRVRLPRNRLTILGACVAGQGSGTASGDVAGFLRAFIAAGAGAIALPLWAVYDSAIVETAGALLRASRAALAGSGSVYAVVDVLHEHYRTVFAESTTAGGPTGWIERMPLTLYT